MAPPPHLLADLEKACAVIDNALDRDWVDCCFSAVECSQSTADLIWSTLSPVHRYLNSALWDYSMDQIPRKVVGDISGPLLELYNAYERAHNRYRCYSDLSLFESILELRQRIAERAERYRLAPPESEPTTGGGAGGEDDDGEDDDDELVPCPRHCGDCGGLRYGCGITRGDLRRWAEARDESEPEEPRDDPPQQFYILTARVVQHDQRTEYYVSRSFTREEALKNMRLVCEAARADAPEWRRADYDKLFWVGKESPEATPRRSADGDYHAYCTIEHIGTLVQPVSTDNTYHLGRISHDKLAAWHFTLEQYREGESEYERVMALPSAWPRAGLPDPEDREEPEPEPPQQFYILTAQVSQHGESKEYYASRSFTRAEALENMRTLCSAVRENVDECFRRQYKYLFWADDDSYYTTPRRGPDGSYRDWCKIEDIGNPGKTEVWSLDSTCSLGSITDTKLPSWTFTLKRYPEGDASYERLTALPSAWPRAGLPDPEGREEPKPVPATPPPGFHVITVRTESAAGYSREFYATCTNSRKAALNWMQMMCSIIIEETPAWQRNAYLRLYWDGEGEKGGKGACHRYYCIKDRSSGFSCYAAWVGNWARPDDPPDHTYVLNRFKEHNLLTWYFTLRPLTEWDDEFHRAVRLPRLTEQKEDRDALPTVEEDEDDDSSFDEAEFLAEYYADY